MSQTEIEPKLSKANSDARKAHFLAINTGVPRRHVLDEDFGEHGIVQKNVFDNQAVMTENASIERTGSQRLETEINLPTGEYSGGFYKDQPFDNAIVERPGYTGEIGGKHAARANEIIAKKAAKEVGETAAKRAVSIGNEYLEQN